METVAWNDEKIDALAVEVREGFALMEARFAAIDARFDARFDAMDSRFDALLRTIIQVGGGLIGTMVVALVTVLVAGG